MTFFSHSFEIFAFSPLFSTLSHLQSYNYNCTIHLLQLQITFYNCRNCDQLHVKICPGFKMYNTIQGFRGVHPMGWGMKQTSS